MPWRNLKDSICTSPNVDALSAEAERFFYRLIVNVDDFGRLDARASVLLAKCFPLKIGDIEPQAVAGWVQELLDAGLIDLYLVDDLPYLQFVTWFQHQRQRAQKSKYPQMSGECLTDASACLTIASGCLRSKKEEGRRKIEVEEGAAATGRPNTFTLYEQNIGMLSPMITDELRDAEKTYPVEWIEAAFREAVEYNKHNWKYVLSILKRWQVEGRGNGSKPPLKKTPKPTHIIDPLTGETIEV